MERYADQVEAAAAQDPLWSVASITTRRRPSNWLSQQADNLIRFPRIVARASGDVYHVIDHGYAHVIRGLPDDRTIVTCHDLMPIRSAMGDAGPRGDRKTLIRFRWTASHLKRAARVICVTEATARDVVSLAGVDPSRCVVIANGVDPAFTPLTEEHRSELRAARHLDGRFALLNVSTGSPYKNLEGVIRTLKRTRDSGLDAVLLRTGRPLPPALRQLSAQLGLSEHVVELGFVPQNELVEIYGVADALLHPSYWEGFGWPPVEAMACALPVVTSTTPALLEVSGPAGLHADADDHGGLCDAVLALTNPATARHQRALGLARAHHLSLARANGLLMSVYSDVANQATVR